MSEAKQQLNKLIDDGCLLFMLLRLVPLPLYYSDSLDFVSSTKAILFSHPGSHQGYV
jgi:hypothetical protein